MNEFVGLWLSPFILSLIIATGIGLIIGLEREFNSTKSNYHFAGIRTFPLMAIAGCMISLVATQINQWIVLAAIPAVIIFIGIAYMARAKENDTGITTELSLFIVFVIGLAAGYQFYKAALAAGIFTTLLLSLKTRFRIIVTSITEEELFAFIKFAILTLLILPLLPDRGMGPNGLLNPFEIGVVVIIVSTVNFIGYFLVKYIGTDRGLLITAFLGGLFSSTAVTWVFSNGSREHPYLSRSYSGGIILATTIMFLRVLMLSLIFNKAIFKLLAAPAILLAASGGVFLFFLLRKNIVPTEQAQLKLGNPLNLANAFGFGIIYIAILLVTNYSDSFFGSQGFYITGFVSGFADLDAISISSAKYALVNPLKTHAAYIVIMLAFLSNTLTKTGIVLLRGTLDVKKTVFLSYGIMAFIGVTYIFVSRFLME